MLLKTTALSIRLFLLLLFVLLLSATSSFAQDAFTNLGTQYQILLGSYPASVQLTDFNNVQDLGILSTTSIEKKTNVPDGLTNVYLGIYLGKNTAEKFLSMVKDRGYGGATLVLNNTALNGDQGKMIASAIQVEMQSRPDLTKLQSMSGTYRFYIILTTKGYQILTVLHNPIQRTHEFKNAMDFFVDRGFDPLSVKFR